MLYKRIPAESWASWYGSIFLGCSAQGHRRRLEADRTSASSQLNLFETINVQADLL